MENLSQPKYIINPDYQLNIGNAFSDGLALFKKDTGTILINYLLTIIMGMIPLCSLLGLGNFYKACRKIENGERTDSGDIFNFDDVIPYLIFAGIMIFGVLALLIPVEVVILVSAVLTEKSGASSGFCFDYDYCGAYHFCHCDGCKLCNVLLCCSGCSFWCKRFFKCFQNFLEVIQEECTIFHFV